MKRLSILSILFAVATSCQQTDFGQKADVTANGSGGFWKLSEVDVRGKSISILEADSLSLVETQSKTVVADDHFNSYIYRTGTEYNIFKFSTAPQKETVSINAVKWDFDFNKKTNQETSWYKIDDDTGVLVLLNVDRSIGVSSRMEISNIIKSSKYDSNLDTIRYTYKPTPAWF